MTLYRFYTIDTSDRISSPAVERDCENDQDAKEQGAKMLDGRPIEIWETARLVIRLEPEKKNSKRNAAE